MRLGPESRRQVGDNYEYIIFNLLQDFGWTLVRKNFEIDVPPDIRKSGQQGVDGAFLYFDPSLKYDVGVHVESKKCKDLITFKSKLPKWLIDVRNAVHYTNQSLFQHPFIELSKTGSVTVQEGLLSVWIDESFVNKDFYLIVQDVIKDFARQSVPLDDFQTTHIVANNRLKQLQAVLTQLWGMIGRLHLSGRYQFMYPHFGACEAPNLMSLTSDYLFLRALTDEKTNQYRLVACFMGETSRQQLKYFASEIIRVLGSYLNEAIGLHTFVWDLSPSDPNKKDLWDAMYRSFIASKYTLPREAITFQGFKPDILALSTRD